MQTTPKTAFDRPFGLIIEDNPDLAIIFSEALQASDFETRIEHDGRAALKYLEAHVPDVVILDLHLPQVSGPEIMAAIKGDARFAETRVLIATADPALAETLQDQADLVLLKPVSFAQLRDLAKRLA